MEILPNELTSRTMAYMIDYQGKDCYDYVSLVVTDPDPSDQDDPVADICAS